MPLNEIPLVVERAKADGVVLSGSDRLSCIDIYRGLIDLVNKCSIPVFIGGEVSVLCKAEIKVAGVEVIGKDLVEGLKKIRHQFPSNRTDRTG